MPVYSDKDRGARIEFMYHGTKYTGTVLGKNGDYYNIKMENGYDVFIIPEQVQIIENTKDYSAPKVNKVSVAGEGKEISLITTGGTIVSRIDYTTGAVFPSLDITDITSKFPYIEEKFRIRHVNFLNILSENMEPDNWVGIAETVVKESRRAGGIVISHGTDTMSYTAAALSFMLKKLSVPVIMTGSQRSSDRPSSDSFLNMEGAINFAGTQVGEVCIAMHETLSDDRIALMRGVRTRKMHSTRRDAFRSIGEKPIGYFQNGRVEIHGNHRNPDQSTEMDGKLEKKVGMIYFHPGMEIEDLERYIEKKKGVVVMGTGLGHMAVKFLDTIKNYTGNGGKILMTSQCIMGPVNLDVYATGRELAAAGVTWVENMLPEVAMVKMMHVLGNYEDADFERVMRMNMKGEILCREQAGDL